MESAAQKNRSVLSTTGEKLRSGREILRLEAIALWKLSYRLDESFARALDLIYACRGSVIVTGIGKAGHVAGKIAATMASVGTPAHFLHPAEAFHGDLGRIHPHDIVLMLSQSGETGEIVQLLRSIREFGIPLIAITASGNCTLGRAATHVLELGELDEAGPLGLAPSTSTTAMLAVGDALALVLARMKGFRPEDFARFHPGGSLGRKLSKVDDHMRPLSRCRVANQRQSVRQVLVHCGQPGRRTGAIMLTADDGELTGLFTDSDLARIFERRQEAALDRPIQEVMVSAPLTVRSGSFLREAMELLMNNRISELPITDERGKPIGLIDVTDLVGVPLADEHDKAASSQNAPVFRVYAGEGPAPTGSHAG